MRHNIKNFVENMKLLKNNRTEGDEMEFEEALKYLKQGHVIVNKNWNGLKNGKKMYIKKQEPDENSLNTEPYILFCSNEKTFPWTPSSLDMWSNNWQIDITVK